MQSESDIQTNLTDAAHSLGENATAAAQKVRSHAKEAWECAQEETKRAVRVSSEYAQEHPISTALVACGVGVIIGLLIPRREPESFSDRYITEPLHHSKGLLLGLLVAGGAMLKRTLASATSAAADIAENVSDAIKPVKKAVENAIK